MPTCAQKYQLDGRASAPIGPKALIEHCDVTVGQCKVPLDIEFRQPHRQPVTSHIAKSQARHLLPLSRWRDPNRGRICYALSAFAAANECGLVGKPCRQRLSGKPPDFARKVRLPLCELEFSVWDTEPSLQQLELIARLHDSGATELPIDHGVPISAKWRALVACDDCKRALRALEATAITSWRNDLRRGSVWINHSLPEAAAQATVCSLTSNPPGSYPPPFRQS